jgi:CPA2 family monovalent cation:H+ antiporter-2
VGFVLRRGLRLALLTGLGLAQTGEFSFVLGEVGRQQGLLSPALHQVFVAGSIVTLMATPFLFRVAPRLARFAGAADRVPARFAAPTPARGAHVVIIGFGLAGQTLARVLAACDVSYVVLEANPVSVAEARSRGEPILFGDATRPAILERLDVARARLVTIAISDPAATRRCVAMTRALAPGVEILVRTRYVAEVDVLSEAGADVVVVEEFEATIDMLSAVLRAFGFAVETITRFSEQMREEGYEVMRAPPALALDPWLAELLGEAATEWMEVPAGAAVGRSLAELDVHARSGASILAVERAGGTTSNPAPAFVLAEGDRLLVIGTAENLRRAQHLLR